MTAEHLATLASLLYGDRWQSALARDLDLNTRTVQRWAKAGAPDWVELELHAHARRLIAELHKILN